VRAAIEPGDDRRLDVGEDDGGALKPVSSHPDVIVIGGGFAGLSAAVALAGRGARVLLLEARPVLGGRAFSFTDPRTGELVDNGQHLLVGCYRETFTFLRTIGAEHHVRLQGELEVHFIDEEGGPSVLRCPPLPSPLHLFGAILEWDALGVSDRLSVLGMVGPLRIARRLARGSDGRIAASPGETVESWLVRNGQSERLRAMLWEPLALAALNQSSRIAAAPPFARVLGQMFGPDRRDAAIGLPSVPLTEMYVEPARRFIEAHGGEVRAGAPAVVRIDGDRLAAVEARGESLRASAVVAAVPWFALPTLLAGETEALSDIAGRASRTSASPIVTVNLWLDRPVLEQPFVGLPGRTLQWVFDTRQAFGVAASHLSLVSSGAAPVVDLPNDALTHLAFDELCQAIPEARDSHLVRATVVRERRATFSLAPGQPARPGTTTAVKGLHIAGDWIDTGLPATIESAVTSGHRAAAACADPA
jgi:squalene-associated FAD-dependent desaturase